MTNQDTKHLMEEKGIEYSDDKISSEENNTTDKGLIEKPSGKCYKDETIFDNLTWLTTKEAAKYLRLTVNALRLKVHRKELPFYKMGLNARARAIRFKKSDLDSLLQSAFTLGECYGN